LNVLESAPVIADSITTVLRPVAGLPVICASHGGMYSAACAVRLGVSAAVFNDAGIGRDRAGVAGLSWLEGFGIPGLAVSHRSARIGDGLDCWTRGVVSVVNEAAISCGVRLGMGVPEAHALLLKATACGVDAVDHHESRHCLDGHAHVPVVALDSNSLVTAEDAGAIVITGSHGGLLGGQARSAIKYAVFAAFYNDAGIGIDNAGISRLPALDGMGIAGIAVDAFSARIGDGLSTYEDGVASFVNDKARSYGVHPGMTVRAVVSRLAEAWIHHTQRKNQ